MFINLDPYLNLYHKNPKEIAIMVLDDIYKNTNITATCGIGTNLYLAKIAMDIISKHSKSNIGYLDMDLYKKYLWHYTPLTKFWSIGPGISTRLNNLGIFDMYDIAHADENILYKEFGINAKLLIDHSKGIETTTMKEIKTYKPKSKSISSSQILFHDYDYVKARNVLIEMIDDLTIELVSKKYFTDRVSLFIGYSKFAIKSLNLSIKLKNTTGSFEEISKNILSLYDNNINKIIPIRRIGISFGINNKKNIQLDLFHNIEDEDKELDLLREVSTLKSKYGKNILLRTISLEKGSNQRERNRLVGGHNAE